jgi:hypothetical protein
MDAAKMGFELPEKIFTLRNALKRKIPPRAGGFA